MIRRRYDSEKVGYWFPIDQYIGGITHAILHLLYSQILVQSDAGYWIDSSQ